MRLTVLTLLVLSACNGDQKVGIYNSPPVVSIANPTTGSSHNENTSIEFEGIVSDAQTASEELLIAWASSIDGELNTTPADSSGRAIFPTSSLTIGNHAITLSATDESGERTDYAIDITIVDVPDAPTLNIVHPANGESGEEGTAFNFVVQVSDLQDAPDTLTVAFESDVDGVFCTPTPDSIGVAECDQALSAGDHRLTFSVTDADGLRAEEEWYFTIIAGTTIDDDGDGWNEDQGDCNDADGSVNPNAVEFYNDRDDDCNGLVDDTTVGYDDDGDGQSEIDGDCDDTMVVTYDGAVETCDGYDNDCDSVVDDNTTCYDDDGDGLSETAGDCNDASAVSYPGAPELEDGLDNDCDTTIDDGTAAYDDDLDGYTENGGDCDDADIAVSPAGTESCNGYDDDCDGNSDEENAVGCFTYYYDYDGDGYGSSVVSGECYCSMSGYYTAANDGDCYDYNSGANPTATTYSTTQRGDGSYDWNCDGSSSKYWTATGNCSGAVWICTSDTRGWSGSVASCGTSANYNTSCSAEFLGCYERTTTYTQKCL